MGFDPSPANGTQLAGSLWIDKNLDDSLCNGLRIAHTGHSPGWPECGLFAWLAIDEIRGLLAEMLEG